MVWYVNANFIFCQIIHKVAYVWPDGRIVRSKFLLVDDVDNRLSFCEFFPQSITKAKYSSRTKNRQKNIDVKLEQQQKQHKYYVKAPIF